MASQLQLGGGQQVTFGGALNAAVSPHLIAPDEVQAGTNVDFSLEWGGVTPRRGSIVYAWETGHGTATVNVHLIARNYGLSSGVWDDPSIPWYTAADNGLSYTGSGTATATPVALATFSGRAGGTQTKVFPVATQFHDYTYIANGTAAFKTNGTNTFDWLIPRADTPTVTFAQQGTFTGSGAKAGAFVGFAGTFSAVEGIVTGTASSSYFGTNNSVILTTASTGDGTRIVLVGTASPFNWENDVTFITLPTGTGVTLGSGTYTLGGAIDFHQGFPDGDVTGTHTDTATITTDMNIGKYGVDYMLGGLPDQQSVVTIHRDLSIGDDTFTNYWHAETTPDEINDAFADPLTLLLEAQGNATYDEETFALNRSRAISPNVGRRLGPSIPNIRRSIGKTAIAGVAVAPWAVSRSDYKFVGTLPNPDFRDVRAVRIIVEFSATGKQIVVGGVVTYGAEGWCLNDQASGIQYYQTYARVENDNIISEGAPSDPSPPQLVQYAYGQIVCGSATNTTAGITHRVFYRTGGLLQDAHRVGSCTITSGTATIYDYNLPDMLIISRPALTRNLWATWPTPTAGTGLPGVNAVSEPWQSRVWVGVLNQLYWSTPGNPSQLQEDVQTMVSDSGDNITAIIPYNNLIIINQASVYELAGSIFEGTNANWTLQRSGARRGSAAPKTCIKTPYGILLFSYDGMSLYRSGYGVDEELDWVYEKIGDLWKGTGTADPAGAKGRIPALNQAAIYNACAAYKDERVYLAVPTGTNTSPDSLFILDIPRKKVWLYTYPFKVNSLFWDRVGNRIMAGTDRGTVQQVEVGLADAAPTGATTGVAWTVRTRAWSTPTDLLLENLQIENIGTWSGLAVVDNTNTYTLTTATTVAKGWTPASLAGTIGDNVSFTFSGTQSATRAEIYQMLWDFYPQTPKVTYFQSDAYSLKDQSGETAEGWWHTLFVDVDCLGTATVTATMFLDQVAVTTQTITSTRTGRQDFPFATPEETYGKVAHTILTASSPFKVYNVSYRVTLEPTPVLFWETAPEVIPSENYVKTWLPDMNLLGGTATARLYIDGTVVSTQTLTNSNTAAAPTSMRRRVHEIGMTNITVGKNVKATYTATTPMKHYRTAFEMEPKPFNKKTWLVTYKKLGGFTQLDMARFYAMDIEGPISSTITSTWIIDGTAFTTDTMTISVVNAGEVTGEGRIYQDQIPFPPGARGYLFQQQLTGSADFRVWKSNMDIDRIGVKGLSRVTVRGTPDTSAPTSAENRGTE